MWNKLVSTIDALYHWITTPLIIIAEYIAYLYSEQRRLREYRKFMKWLRQQPDEWSK